MEYKKITKENLLKAVKKELGIDEEQRKKPESLVEFLKDNIDIKESNFIKKAYRLVLKREADLKGLSHYSEILKEGKISRAGLVLSLYFSEEGRKKDISIKEIEEMLKKIGWREKLLKNKIAKRVLMKWMEWKIRKIENNKKENIKKEILEKSEFNEKEEVIFLERFRGNPDKIKEHLNKKVLPLIKKAVLKIYSTEEIRAVDLGCGRGEWLELLKEENIYCEGVDLNSILVNELIEKGFLIQKKDAFGFLKGTEDESYHIVSGFHLIEHLPVGERTKFLKEVCRVLKKGGIAIFETPNPRNILVGAGDFYRDPSHLVPLFPDTFEFMGEIAGFKESTVFFYGVERLIPAKEAKFDTIEDYLRISRDYLWVGGKK